MRLLGTSSTCFDPPPYPFELKTIVDGIILGMSKGWCEPIEGKMWVNKGCSQQE